MYSKGMWLDVVGMNGVVEKRHVSMPNECRKLVNSEETMLNAIRSTPKPLFFDASMETI